MADAGRVNCTDTSMLHAVLLLRALLLLRAHLATHLVQAPCSARGTAVCRAAGRSRMSAPKTIAFMAWEALRMTGA
jgi:hypothetical protein